MSQVSLALVISWALVFTISCNTIPKGFISAEVILFNEDENLAVQVKRAVASEKELVFSPGVYDFSQTDEVVINGSLKISTDGKGVVFLPNSGVMFRVVGAANFKISNVEVRGGGVFLDAGRIQGGSVAYNDCNFSGMTCALYSKVKKHQKGFTSKFSVLDCKFSNLQLAINSNASFSKFEILGCEFIQLSKGGVRLGSPDGSNQLWMNANVSKNFFKSIISVNNNQSTFAILCYGEKYTISNNQITEVHGGTKNEVWGIYTQVTKSLVSDNTISNISTKGAQLYAINIKGDSPWLFNKGVMGHNNVIDNNEIHLGKKGVGIRLYNDQLVCKNNRIIGGHTGIQTSSSQYYKSISVFDNMISGSQGSMFGVDVILREGESIFIKDNVVDGYVCGVRLYAVEHLNTVTLTGNKISICGKRGVYVKVDSKDSKIDSLFFQNNQVNCLTNSSSYLFDGIGTINVVHFEMKEPVCEKSIFKLVRTVKILKFSLEYDDVTKCDKLYLPINSRNGKYFLKGEQVSNEMLKGNVGMISLGGMSRKTKSGNFSLEYISNDSN